MKPKRIPVASPSARRAGPVISNGPIAYTLRKINRAMIVPEIIIAIRKIQLLTAI
jgi:hypothetical protein